MRTVLFTAILATALWACVLPTTEPPRAKSTAPGAGAQATELPPAATQVASASATPVPMAASPTPIESVETLPDPASATWQSVTTGLRQPLDLQHAGDDRLFVVEQRGTVRIFAGGELLAEPFLDIRDRVVDSASEQGLLGLAFDPNFASNGRFFVNYTGSGGHTRIARFRLSPNPDRADPTSEQVLLTIQQPFRNHNGGGLAFGPDGYLYVGTGDGGAAGDPEGNGQDLGTLLGKLLRIDVSAEDSYGIPADNPLVDREGAQPEIWAFGLRNPWRFSFDSAVGDLYIGDVGQNQWEEVNHEPADSPGGLNYGWDLLEGTHPFEGGGEGTVLPVAEYDHSLGCSVTGGVVVRTESLPAWQGVYLYGDFCSGNIWGLVRDGGGRWLNQLLYTSEYRVSSFGLGATGDVYLLDHNGGVHRLAPAD